MINFERINLFLSTNRIQINLEFILDEDCRRMLTMTLHQQQQQHLIISLLEIIMHNKFIQILFPNTIHEQVIMVMILVEIYRRIISMQIINLIQNFHR